jgi:hypothetical protein
MKYVSCQNSKPDGKYFKGRICYEEVLIDDNSKSALCWKCTTFIVPPPEEKKSSGYPRGWKFMTEFVDKEGNVYHKGKLQPELFGTLPPSEIKQTNKKRKNKQTMEDKIIIEYSKLTKPNSKKNKGRKL